jgi:hypothetical protein
MEGEFENNMVVTAEDRTYPQGIPPLRRSKSVSPGLFRTLGTRLLAGRDFTWTEPLCPPGDDVCHPDRTGRGGRSRELLKGLIVFTVGEVHRR